MTTASPNAYLRTKVMTASPAELRMMLFEGAIKFAEQAKTALEQREYEAAHNGLVRAQNIVMELINSLQPKHDPELCERLSALYTFVYQQLVSAGMQRQPELVEEALNLLRFERETWGMLLERLADENRRANKLQTTPDCDPPRATEGTAAESLIGGRVSVSG
jgi:flagellar protein FliS